MVMKMKKKIYLIIGIVLIIVVFVFVLFITMNKDNSSSNNINNDNDISQEDDKGKLKTKTYKINSDNLYVNKYEKQYTDYSKLTEVIDMLDVKYYINNGDLFKDDGGNISKIDISGEQAKYLAIGSDCGGVSIFVLTNNGNVYGRSYTDEEIKLIYNGNDAEELLVLNESKIFTTCGEKMVNILKDNELYSIYEESTTRKDISPFSIAFYADDNNNSKILLYPDGSVNNYMYCSDAECALDNSNIKNEFITDNNGNKILVSFIFSKDNINYIIDTNGNMFKLNVPSFDTSIGISKFTIEKEENINLSKIDYVEVSSYTKEEIYNYKNYEVSDKIETLTIFDIDGKKISFTSMNNSLKYIDELYH